MERSTLEHTLTSFQAFVRGYLVRREVQHSREDFEAIVREIDGSLTHLHWKKSLIPIPHFTDTDGPLIPTSRAASNPPNSGTDVLRSPLERQPSFERADKRAHRTQAERDDSRTKIPQLSKDPCVISGVTEGQKGAGVEYKDGRMTGGAGDSTTVWSGMELDLNCGRSQKGSRQYCLAQDVPRNPEALDRHRNALTMELLWLQQAIDSRKKYLSLKNKLSVS